MSPRKKLRALLANSGYAIVPGAYDTLTAKLVQLAAFDAVYLTGGGYSRANGYPDLGLLTMTEVVQWISRTVEAVEIPVGWFSKEPRRDRGVVFLRLEGD